VREPLTTKIKGVYRMALTQAF